MLNQRNQKFPMLKLRDSDYSVSTLNRCLRSDISMVAIFRRLKNPQLDCHSFGHTFDTAFRQRCGRFSLEGENHE
jgi:hypothetical protein